MLHHRLFLFTIVFLLGATTALVFLAQAAVKTRDDFLQIRAAVTELEARARRVDALQARWENVREEGERIDLAILERKDLPAFFTLIESTAAAAGVAEKTSLVEEVVGEMRFRLQVSGEFQNLFVFVTHLNVLPTLLFVEEVDVRSGASGKQGTTTLPAADVLIRVPIHGNDEVATSADQKVKTSTSETETEE